jgi:hypothetical protein
MGNPSSIKATLPPFNPSAAARLEKSPRMADLQAFLDTHIEKKSRPKLMRREGTFLRTRKRISEC